MKDFGYFRAILMSFYSQDLYRDVARKGNGDVFLYLLLVLFLTWLPATFQIQTHMKTMIPTFVDEILPQVPEVVIKNGEVNTPENRPYVIRNPDSKKIEGVIDTSGQYINLDHPVVIDMLLTKTEFITRDSPETIKIHKLPPTLNFDFSPEKVKEKLVSWTPWIAIVLFPFMLFMSFIFRLVVAAFNSIFGLFFSLILDVKLSYPSLYRVAIVAMTPVIIVRTLLDFVGATNVVGLTCFALALIYLFFGVYANKDK